ncbi:MBL fold metallo-hydrolase [Bacillus sp. SA1-12]|uniref:MBL fold metallo-hydrolase n=1 Tax=Bacillus sp. SA1-12 TaxID=1455638 RepID=UPI0006987F29|nr:MBL fold metallo-hydrolase [Bacillus sp. SA1-12]
MMRQISPNLYVYKDTCNVYVIKTRKKAILIDFGSGDVLVELPSIGIEEVTDIFMTHHHRDQAQGLELAARKGIRIRVPHTEQDLFQHVDEHWKARTIDNNYNMRQDRFSLFKSVPVHKTLKDYETIMLNGNHFTIVPTPGHTTGSISIFAEIDNTRTAFTGDLIYAPGKVWSLSATQWSYNGGEGIALSILSLLDLKDRKPDILLPSHGEMMDQPIESINLLVDRFTNLMKQRKQNPRLFQLREEPYKRITENLLMNRTSMANSYVLISKSRKALFLDFGYDFIGGIAAGSDRTSRRPWLYTISTLKKQYEIDKIDVVIPTHYHDDHVAGLNLLRDVEGTEIWCPENFADILKHPKTYDLPCIWYDPISIDRILPLKQKVRWEEYDLTLYQQAGHTLYAAAIEFEVDGKRVIAIGDQYQGNEDANYVYHNKFRIWDYVDSAELYKTIKPDLLLSGHWDPISVTENYLNQIVEKGRLLEKIHRELLPLEEIDFGADGFAAIIQPYQLTVNQGESFTIEVEIKNPFNEEKEVKAKMFAPKGWIIETSECIAFVPSRQAILYKTTITVPKEAVGYRERIAVDVTIGEQRFGQQAEALISIQQSTIGSSTIEPTIFMTWGGNKDD